MPEGHRARLVWSYVAGQDLEHFYERIRVREGGVGQAALAPEILLSLWLYATLGGAGSAREGHARMTDVHDAYRWLCGGVQVNYQTLSEFRKDHRETLDELLSADVATLIAAGVVKLRQVAHDGMRVRANAGAGGQQAGCAAQGRTRSRHGQGRSGPLGGTVACGSRARGPGGRGAGALARTRSDQAPPGQGSRSGARLEDRCRGDGS